MIGDTACKNISIQEDLETEGLETFTVSLLSGDESLFVEITIGIVTVVIIDNESKLFSYIHCLKDYNGMCIVIAR